MGGSEYIYFFLWIKIRALYTKIIKNVNKLVTNWRFLIDYINEIEVSYTEEAMHLVKSVISISKLTFYWFI